MGVHEASVQVLASGESKEDSVKKVQEPEHKQPAGEDAGQGDTAAGPVRDGDGSPGCST